MMRNRRSFPARSWSEAPAAEQEPEPAVQEENGELGRMDAACDHVVWRSRGERSTVRHQYCKGYRSDPLV